MSTLKSKKIAFKEPLEEQIVDSQSPNQTDDEEQCGQVLTLSDGEESQQMVNTQAVEEATEMKIIKKAPLSRKRQNATSGQKTILKKKKLNVDQMIKDAQDNLPTDEGEVG